MIMEAKQAVQQALANPQQYLFNPAPLPPANQPSHAAGGGSPGLTDPFGMSGGGGRGRSDNRPVCQNWSKTGRCRFGNTCKFSHGNQDTAGGRTGASMMDADSWGSPMSGSAPMDGRMGGGGPVKEPCRNHFQKGRCKYGNRCKHSHNRQDLDLYNQQRRQSQQQSQGGGGGGGGGWGMDPFGNTGGGGLGTSSNPLDPFSGGGGGGSMNQFSSHGGGGGGMSLDPFGNSRQLQHPQPQQQSDPWGGRGGGGGTSDFARMMQAAGDQPPPLQHQLSTPMGGTEDPTDPFGLGRPQQPQQQAMGTANPFLAASTQQQQQQQQPQQQQQQQQPTTTAAAPGGQQQPTAAGPRRYVVKPNMTQEQAVQIFSNFQAPFAFGSIPEIAPPSQFC